MQGDLRSWINAHLYWISEISHDLLHRKGIKTNDYLAQIMEPGAPVNEIGLLIFSRMYHIHIHVLLNGYFWTTNKTK